MKLFVFWGNSRGLNREQSVEKGKRSGGKKYVWADRGKRSEQRADGDNDEKGAATGKKKSSRKREEKPANGLMR